LDTDLAKQLVAIKWKMTSKGQIAVESKEEMRKRGVPSPDRADGLVYAFAVEGAQIDVESHACESITWDLMTKAW
jgi:phage terminase large subunit